jgi:hypothetical protein
MQTSAMFVVRPWMRHGHAKTTPARTVRAGARQPAQSPEVRTLYVHSKCYFFLDSTVDVTVKNDS